MVPINEANHDKELEKAFEDIRGALVQTRTYALYSESDEEPASLQATCAAILTTAAAPL